MMYDITMCWLCGRLSSKEGDCQFDVVTHTWNCKGTEEERQEIKDRTDKLILGWFDGHRKTKESDKTS